MTTVIKATRSNEDKEHLKGKKGHRPSEKRRRLEAQERGTRLHALLRDAIEGREVDVPEDVKRFWEVARLFPETLERVYQSEVSGYHPTLPYAGIPDLVAQWGGRASVFDFKTGSYRKEARFMEEAFLQAAAYREMVNAWESAIPRVSQIVILVFLPNDVQVFRAADSDADMYGAKWLKRLSEYSELPLSEKLCVEQSV